MCRGVLPLTQFHKNKSKRLGVNNICKECRSDYSRDYYGSNRERHAPLRRERRARVYNEVDDYLRGYKESNPCADCGGYFPACVMDFDHLRDKSLNVSETRRYGIERMKEEMAKCELVCANCHRIRTHLGR